MASQVGVIDMIAERRRVITRPCVSARTPVPGREAARNGSNKTLSQNTVSAFYEVVTAG